VLNPPENWFCCLSPVEQDVFAGVLVHWFDLSFHIFQDEFDLLWAVSDPDNNPVRKALFIYEYKLTLTDCPISEEETAPCYAMNTTLWLILALFSLTEGYTCPDPCHIIPSYALA